MNATETVIPPARRSLGEVGNGVEHPSSSGGNAAVRRGSLTHSQPCYHGCYKAWILRPARNDKAGLSILRAVLCLLFSGLGLLVRGSEPADLSGDLGYLRVHSIGLEREAISAALAKPRALVLDLRYPTDERDAGEILRQALARPASARLYVLVSPATPVPVVGAIASNPTRLTTLGVKGSRPEPQVVVLQSSDDDRRAYDALMAGTPLANLVSGKIEKERYDEASLVHEFKNGVLDPKPPASPAGGESARLTDRVLQRAVHLHRALQALRR